MPTSHRPARILVTGGAGFIGSHYVRHLLGPDGPVGIGQVTVLDKLTYAGNRTNLEPVHGDPLFAFVHGDICDQDLVDRLLADHDQIVHFAAESHVDRSILDATQFARTNVLGTHTLLDSAVRNGGKTFVHVSTDEVYGSTETGSWTEQDPLQPNSPYSATKAASDLLVLAHHRTHGLDARITRCPNNYGSHHFPEKVIPLFVTNLLDGRSVPLYGDGSQVREWLHVHDHVQGVELVRTRGRAGEVYNIGGGTELSNLELTRAILAACGAGWNMVQRVADRKGHDRRYSVDCQKIIDELGYQPRRDFATGLAATVAWYRDNRFWWDPLKRRAFATTER